MQNNTFKVLLIYFTCSLPFLQLHQITLMDENEMTNYIILYIIFEAIIDGWQCSVLKHTQSVKANLRFCFYSSSLNSADIQLLKKYTKTGHFKCKDENLYLINNHHPQGSKRKTVSFQHQTHTLNCCNYYCWRLCLKLENVNQSLNELEKGLLYNTSAARNQLNRR